MHDPKQDSEFVQEYLYIEEYIPKEKTIDNEDKEEDDRGVYIYDIFGG